MSLGMWIGFWFAIIYDAAYIGSVYYCTYKENHTSGQEARDWGNLARDICLFGMLPMGYSMPFIFFALGFGP